MALKRYRMRYVDRATKSESTLFCTFNGDAKMSAEDRAIAYATERAIGAIKVDEVDMTNAGLLYAIAQISTL